MKKKINGKYATFNICVIKEILLSSNRKLLSLRTYFDHININ